MRFLGIWFGKRRLNLRSNEGWMWQSAVKASSAKLAKAFSTGAMMAEAASGDRTRKL